MKNNLTSKILNVTVLLGLTITCILLFAAPLIVTAFFKSAYSILDSSLVMSVVACIYLCATPYVIALFNLKKLCGIIAKNNPFSSAIAKSLKIISICSFSEMILFLGCVWYLKNFVEFFEGLLWVGPFTVITVVATTIGLLALVASRLFELFINIKDENDKTI